MSSKVLVFCPCSELIEIGDVNPEQLDDLPPTISNTNTLHPLSYLNFCETCQAVKCRKCTELEVVTKFCPKCMNVMRPEYQFCSKNCFDCPLCFSHVTIHQKPSSRSYKMKCLSCDWKYETGELDKPRALSRVINAKINENEDVLFFDGLERYYLQKKQIQQGMEVPKEIYIRFNELKLKEGLKESNLDDFIRKNTIIPLDLTKDNELLELRSNMKTNETVLPLEQCLSQKIFTFNKSQVQPVSTRLRTKCSKRCKACRTTLMKPDADPTSTKFYKLSNAIDCLPNIQIHKRKQGVSLTDLKFLLSIKNPRETQMEVSLSTYTTLPGGNPHRIHLPVSNVKLGPKPDNSNRIETFIKLIPSVELTKNSKLSRVELMNRPPPNSDDEAVYEQDHNFAVIPLKVSLQTMENHPLKIPLFITVRTETSSFGYWSVLDLGIFGEDPLDI